MIVRRLLPLTILICCLTIAASGQPPKLATVKFFVTDGFGTELSTGTFAITITITSHSRVATSRVLDYTERQSLQLEAGDYTVVTVAQGFLPRSQGLNVARMDLFVPVALDLAPLEGSSAAKSLLSGKVAKRYIGQRPIWLRVIGVLNEVDRTVEVDESGVFTVDALPPGRYSLLLLNRGALKEVRTVDLRAGNNELSLD